MIQYAIPRASAYRCSSNADLVSTEQNGLGKI